MIDRYDYAIVGAGAAGLQLAYELVKDSHFDKCTILIIDQSDKSTNDRTWSFWEKDNIRYDDILWADWSIGEFHGSNKSTTFDLNPYRYKTLRSSSFYAFMKKALNRPNITWLREEVLSVKESDDHAEIGTNLNNYRTRHCFDSRLSKNYHKTKDDHIHILQHFKGYFIKTKNSVFDPSTFVMMDYRLQHKDHTSFTYVLPQSSNIVMIEFTLFDHQLLESNQYDDYLKKYISDILKIDDYEIIEEEFGIIPMTTYPFHKDHTPHITKIGTAGGWVRASSGYQFRNAMTNAQKIKSNLLKGRHSNKNIGRRFQRWMDHIFLSVLDKENERGSEVFQAIYLNNTIQSTFTFLDEDSSFFQKIKMIISVPWGPFVRAAWRWLAKG